MNAKQIKKVIEQRLDMWEAGRFNKLCNEVINKGKGKAQACHLTNGMKMVFP